MNEESRPQAAPQTLAKVSNESVAQGTGPTQYRRSLDAVLADPAFREWQAGWRRRIRAARRLAALDDGTVDPLAPAGRWQ